ncbi:MAG: hypothetical protein ACFCU4_01435 [Puniceicoccaceae bacterium]
MILHRLLVHRFGEWDYKSSESLNHAGSEELHRWGERILSVGTTEEVFDE